MVLSKEEQSKLSDLSSAAFAEALQVIQQRREQDIATRIMYHLGPGQGAQHDHARTLWQEQGATAAVEWMKRYRAAFYSGLDFSASGAEFDPVASIREIEMRIRMQQEITREMAAI